MPTGHGSPIPAAIYARVSSDSQDINNSLEGQLSECRQYAKQHGMAVVQTYIDPAESGTKSDRPEFQRMVADATSPGRPFRVILIWKFSRFSRSRLDNALYKHLLKKNNIRVISIKEPVDDGPAGEMTEAILEAMDAFYSANLSQEVRRGQRQVALRGFYPGRTAPFGLKIVKVKEDQGNAVHNKLEADPPRDRTVRRIFDEAIAGRSMEEIRAGLIQDGVPSPQGGKWASSTVHTILHNLCYAGYIVWGANSRSGDPPTVAPDCHQAIVSRAEFDLAQQVLASKHRKAANPRQTGSVHMMSGLLKCWSCGDNLIARPSKNQTSHYYMCRTRRHDGAAACRCPNLNTKQFEERFLAAVVEDILSPGNVRTATERIARELTGPYEEQATRLQAINEELAAIEQKRERIMTAYEAGAYTVADFARRAAPLRESETELKRKRESAAREIETQAKVIANPQEVIDFSRDVAGFIRNSPPKDRKQALRRFIKCVWIEADKARIVYRIPLPGDGSQANAKETELALTGPVLPTIHSSPHKRGCTSGKDRCLTSWYTIPAHAGIHHSPDSPQLLPAEAGVHSRFRHQP